ncbi:MAG: hypothetical protein JJT96_05670 [Opitutales bacterium]|nr:hypothetical protein [Opitutales bacterium]
MLACAEDAAPPRLRDLQEEQRLINSHLTTAVRELSEARTDYSVGLFNKAWIGVGAAGIEHDNAKRLLDGHPQRIERFSGFFGGGESTRRSLREGFGDLHAQWHRLQRDVVAMERDIGQQLGIDVTWGRTLLDSLKRMRDATTDPALKAQLDATIARLEAAVRSGNAEAFAQAVAEGERVLRDGMTRDAGAAAAVSGEVRDGLQSRRSQGLEGSSSQSARGLLEEIDARLADPNLSPNERARLEQLRREITQALASGDTDRLQRLITTGLPRRSEPGSGAPGGARAGNVIRDHPGTPAGYMAVRDPETGEIRFFRSSDLSGVNAGYIGNRGERLVKEARETLEEVPGSGGTSVFRPRVVEARDWSLRIQQVSENVGVDGYTVRFRLTDRLHSGNFQVSRWEVVGPGGVAVAKGPAGNEFEFSFPSAGQYSVVAHGVTDWGSDFSIRTSLDVAF